MTMMETTHTTPTPPGPSGSVPAPAWWLRVLLVLVGLAAWFWTQSLIARRAFPENQIGDALHTLSAPLHQSLLDHPRGADTVLILSSLFQDLFAIFLLGRSIFGPTTRPFLGLLLL